MSALAPGAVRVVRLPDRVDPVCLAAREAARGIDIRLIGSGNVGAANAYRATGPGVAVLVVALDLAKGGCAVLIASRAGQGAGVQAASGVAAVLGHVFPVWLGFRGGKGVATSCGVFAVLAPVATALAGLVFVIAVWWTRYVSLGSVAAAIAASAAGVSIWPRRPASSPRRSCARRSSWSATERTWRAFSAEPSGG